MMKIFLIILMVVAAVPGAWASGGMAESTQGLIGDLAWILLLGAVATLLFKKLGQPVVLGYILAGFLASPKFEYLPTITTAANIEFWAEIGIVVLMFTLGLEFSFKKLVRSGSSAIITALVIITGMTVCGFGVGRLMGMNVTNAIFLGGMLSMSSTTIILKAFTDLGLKGRKFAGLVLAVLIIEDLFAVLMLVLLSSLAVGDVSGSELALAVGKLLFYLILWYVIGVWFLPTMLARMRRFMNPETLLVVSMGICFGMAVLSVICGFSLELGSFIAGSILAGTVMAERIEHVVAPVKDLFGAVFFISVGMMVDPGVIVQHWPTILLLAAVVIVGMILFGATGMLLTGQSLRVAVESGFSLTQIGEFSFIIASLGMGLGVLEPSLYPIIVAVSVITIFTTPYFIGMAPGAYLWLERHLPAWITDGLARYSRQTENAPDTVSEWKGLLSRYVWRLLLFTVMLVAIMTFSHLYLRPWLEGMWGGWGKLLTGVITVTAMVPFMVALVVSGEKKGNGVPLVALKIVRYVVAEFFPLIYLTALYNIGVGIVVTGLMWGIYLLTGARGRLLKQYKGMEEKFLGNLNQRERVRTGRGNPLTGDLHLAYIEVDASTPFVGERIEHAGLRRDYGVSVSEIRRDMSRLSLPGKDERILPGDTLGIIGTDEQIQTLNADIAKWRKALELSARDDAPTELMRIRLTEKSPVAGMTLEEAPLHKDYHAMLVRVVGAKGEEIPLSPQLRLRPGDTLWVVGEPEYMRRMI